MTTALVVDDSTVDRRLAGRLLEKQLDLEVIYAKDGKAAIKSIQTNPPDLVLTDLHMPQMTGLELVEQIRANHPLIPVILMTAFGSDEIAVQALEKGAASYVPKRLLASELAKTVEGVLLAARTGREHDRLLHCLTETESKYVLENDASLIAPLIGHVEIGLKAMRLCDQTGLIRVAVALGEAVLIAIEQGNLQVNPALREEDEAAYHRLVEERAKEEPYRDRRVHVQAKHTHDQAAITVRHEGPGIESYELPDHTDPAHLETLTSRGLVLIRTFMDEVFDEAGQGLTMIKRRDLPRSMPAK